MLEFIAIGPGRKTGAYYAGYVKPCTKIFVPLVDCATIEQARSAAAELEKDSIARELATGIKFKRDRVAYGFYDDSE